MITEKLAIYSTQLTNALDSNDYLEALKIRAIQKELQCLLPIAEEEDEWAKTFFDTHYTSQEAANALDLDPSNLTRKPEKYRGKCISGRWYFPKEEINAIRFMHKNGSKPGPKRKSV